MCEGARTVCARVSLFISPAIFMNVYVCMCEGPPVCVRVAHVQAVIWRAMILCTCVTYLDIQHGMH